MKHMIENLVAIAKIKNAMEKHESDPKALEKMPLYVPITSILMDDAHTMDRRAKVLAATVTSFVSESAPAYKDFKPEHVKEAISGAFDEAINIISQLRDRIGDDESFKAIVLRNYENDYKDIGDEPEDDEGVTVEKVDANHPLHALFKQLATEIEKAKRDTDAVRPLH
ncbi:hypothetical protein [Pseudoalteromonas sp. UBA6610]|uniref:hypothetical protein n=1 Tax=Pseudoalteromonas sp. UBA6610 TaxID=1947294 RepID=UPI0025991F1F|nr:hypothetical protein [Pseudoalteromonas sp. UBA6610]|tara:strand:- start:25856 stop:26359 length:504 start_codon:yes stop_codon:yes gene_type:complete